MLLPNVLNSLVGVKHAASVLLITRVVEMLMLNFTTQMDQMMLVCGRLTQATGLNVQVEMLHVTLDLILLVLRKYLDGVETHGNIGLLAVHVDAATEHDEDDSQNHNSINLS